MSNVILTIGGRSFTVACAPGEEAHIAGLGRMIDDKLAAMGDLTGQSESRVLLFAALFLADELHEARSTSETVAPAPPAAAPELDKIAETLEKLAERLEHSLGNT